MLKRLVTLSVLCAALAAFSSAPAGTARYCLPGDITDDCRTGIWCCDRYGCTCGYP